MPLHFSTTELADRRAAACRAMAARGLDAMLIVKPESQFYLTGYDTFGYVYFQALLLTRSGQTALLTRAPDMRQARFTSDIEDIRIWVDAAGVRPVDHAIRLLADYGLVGKTIGVEWDSYALPAKTGFQLAHALDAAVTPHADASDLVDRLRLIKSPSEMAYVRRAAELVDAMMAAGIEAAGPGAFEGDILAALQAAGYRGGGDDPANEQILGSGPGALMCRYFTGRRHLDARDQLTLEIAGVCRHYHAALMRTISIGPPPPRQVAMHEACVTALDAAQAALRPGRPLGDVFEAHAAVLDDAGLAAARMNACGYALGTTYAPNWMDAPTLSMFHRGNETLAAPGMVFFIHIIAYDSESDERPGGLAMTSGATVLVTADGAERLTRTPTDLVVR